MKLKPKKRYKELVYDWLIYKKDYVKESTYANYSNVVYNHLVPDLGNTSLKDINHNMLQQYIINKLKSGSIIKNNPLSEKTVKDIMMVLKNSLKYAINQGMISQINLGFIYPKNHNKHKIYIPTKREQSKIIISNPKTINSNRDIPINKDFAAIIKPLKINSKHYVLTSSLNCVEPRTYRKHFSSMLKKLNIKPINFHSLRHTFATNCISLGIDYKTVSELLGHSDISITLNLYVHPNLTQKKKCMNMIWKSHTKV